MPRCYLLTVCAGSSLDQHSNNATLFNLVEQLNVPPGMPAPPSGVIPLEIHAYFAIGAGELQLSFDVRFAMVAPSGLETLSDIFTHRSSTPRYRTRTAGLPLPPVIGHYDLRVDWRMTGTSSWTRDVVFWPISIVEATPRPVVTH